MIGADATAITRVVEEDGTAGGDGTNGGGGATDGYHGRANGGKISSTVMSSTGGV